MDSMPKKLTGSGTTTFGSVYVTSICVNKTLTGTLTINEGGTAVGQMAAGTLPNNYHTIVGGGRYSNLTIVLSAGDDVTVYTRVA